VRPLHSRGRERCQVNSPAFATHSRADISTTGNRAKAVSRHSEGHRGRRPARSRVEGDSVTSRHRTRILNMHNTLRAIGFDSPDSLPGTVGRTRAARPGNVSVNLGAFERRSVPRDGSAICSQGPTPAT